MAEDKSDRLLMVVGMGALTLLLVPVFVGLVAVGAAVGAVFDPFDTTPASPLQRVHVVAAVDASGAAEVTTEYQFRGDEAAKIRIDSPADGAVDAVTLDGDPVRTASDMTTFDADGTTATVVSSLRGTVERTTAVAMVRFGLWRQTGQGDQRDPLVPIDVTLHLPAGATPLTDDGAPRSRWFGISDVHVSRVGTTYRVTGRMHPERNVTVVLVTAPGAFPAVPAADAVQPGSRRVDRTFAAVQRADDAYFAAAAAARRRRTLLIDGYWWLLGAEAVLPLAVALLGAARGIRQRRVAAAAAPDRLEEPPDQLDPALVALLDQGGNALGARSVAATLCDLTMRGAVEVDHTTSVDFRARPAARPPTGLSAAEGALLDELTRVALTTADGWVHSPLPLVRGGTWWRVYRRDVVRRGKALGLLRRRFPSGIFVVSVGALLLTSGPLWGTSPQRAVIAWVVALCLLALSALGGFRLTGEGLASRARWRAFGTHLGESVGLRASSVPGVVVWGPNLTAAAALGIAGPAIAACSGGGGDVNATEPMPPPATPPSTPTRVGAVGPVLAVLGLCLGGGLAAQRQTPTPTPTAPIPDRPAVTCAVGSRTDARIRLLADGGSQASLVGADLSCQDLHGLRFTQADLSGADLRNADLQASELGQVDLVGADLRGADLRRAGFGQADLTGADLTGADLRAADFIQATLYKAVLRKVRARGAKFGQATMSLADLRGADLTEADFGQTHLVRVDASGATFTRADLTQADLGESDFTGARFARADLGVSAASAAVFDGADLTDAKWVDILRRAGADLHGATGLPRSQTKAWLGAAGIVAVVLVLLVVIVGRSRMLSSR